MLCGIRTHSERDQGTSIPGKIQNSFDKAMGDSRWAPEIAFNLDILRIWQIMSFAENMGKITLLLLKTVGTMLEVSLTMRYLRILMGCKNKDCTPVISGKHPVLEVNQNMIHPLMCLEDHQKNLFSCWMLKGKHCSDKKRCVHYCIYYEVMKTLVFMDICGYHQNATRDWQVSVSNLCYTKE